MDVTISHQWCSLVSVTVEEELPSPALMVKFLVHRLIHKAGSVARQILCAYHPWRLPKHFHILLACTFLQTHGGRGSIYVQINFPCLPIVVFEPTNHMSI